MTYTLAILQVDQSSYEDIKRRIEEIDRVCGGQYRDMFLSDGGIDLTHIAIQPDPTCPSQSVRDVLTARDAKYLLDCMRGGHGAGRPKPGDMTALEAMDLKARLLAAFPALQSIAEAVENT